MKGGVEWLGAIGKESRSSGIASLADSGLWSMNNDGLRMECEKEVIEGTFFTPLFTVYIFLHIL